MPRVILFSVKDKTSGKILTKGAFTNATKMDQVLANWCRKTWKARLTDEIKALLVKDNIQTPSETDDEKAIDQYFGYWSDEELLTIDSFELDPDYAPE